MGVEGRGGEVVARCGGGGEAGARGGGEWVRVRGDLDGLLVRADAGDAAVGEEEEACVDYGAEAGGYGEEERGGLPGVGVGDDEVVEDVEEADGAGEAAGLVDGVGLKEGVADCEGEQGAERVACGEDGEAEDPDCGLVDA